MGFTKKNTKAILSIRTAYNPQSKGRIAQPGSVLPTRRGLSPQNKESPTMKRLCQVVFMALLIAPAQSMLDAQPPDAPDVSHALQAIEQQDYKTAIEILRPLA